MLTRLLPPGAIRLRICFKAHVMAGTMNGLREQPEPAAAMAPLAPGEVTVRIT